MRLSLNLLYRLPMIMSLSTPAEISSEAMTNVEGNTEFAKLFVSVVIPVMSAVAASFGRRVASFPTGGSFFSM